MACPLRFGWFGRSTEYLDQYRGEAGVSSACIGPGASVRCRSIDRRRRRMASNGRAVTRADRSSMRRASACSPTASPTCRPARSPPKPAYRCRRCTTTSGREGLILALLETENRRRLERQQDMYESDLPLWQRYEQACDFLEDDLESGYVRVLQEIISAGWSEPAIGAAVRELLIGLVPTAHRRDPPGRVRARQPRPVHRRRARHVDRQLVPRVRGDPALGLRSPDVADPLRAASLRQRAARSWEEAG